MSAPVAVFQKTHGLTKFSVHSETGYLTKDETDKISSRLESASTHSRSLYVLELLLLLFVIVGVLIVGGVDAHNEWQPVPGSGKPVSPLFIATYVLGGLLMICLVLYCLGYRIDKDLKANT
ncbi:hypothetical protein EDD86DRAFT_278319 [Gorgonomyces haynaldii]|nr:hypothetical protein EDD86DRAFT_278319 [Gorgonomyces haynaldii]